MTREMPDVRGMPWGIALFLAYALAILAGVGLVLGFVVDQAQTVPVTPLGLVVMALLAYTIFTVTVVLQRKAASRSLALGLATLALPAIPLALFVGQLAAALLIAALAFLLFRGLRAPAAAAWLDQP
jgi:fatty-acid desaturase